MSFLKKTLLSSHVLRLNVAELETHRKMDKLVAMGDSVELAPDTKNKSFIG